MKSYQELEVWQRSVALVVKIYQTLTRKMPAEERYGLIGQMQRCAISIPSNIAEGWGRGTTKEYIKFLKISRGSLMELETQIYICKRLSYITAGDFVEVEKDVTSIGMMLNRLIQSLQRRG